MRTVAPAKINWTLEVLGRREDGYHEIRSVMQTINLCDEVVIKQAPDLLPEGERPAWPPGKGPWTEVRSVPVQMNWGGDMDSLLEDGSAPWADVAHRAALLLDPVGKLDARIDLRKHVPVAAGFGGGSSDAAAVLRVLNVLWKLGRRTDELSKVAQELGSDVSFFLYGGTALAEGRGERITPLPDAPATWLVLLVPPIRMAEKTKRMYEAISAEDFSDGSRTEKLSQRLRKGKAVREEDLYNVFERVAYKVFEGLETYREALLSAGAEAVHLAGAGPALFALQESEAQAIHLAARVQAPEGKVFVTRTLTAAEATAVTD